MGALESSQTENSRILNVVAHDLRSPVNGIHGMAELILLNTDLPKETLQEVEMIKKISNDSLQFVNDLLDINNSFTLEEKSKTDLLDLIDYCVNFMQLKAAQKNQNIIINGNHVFISIYREQIWRVLNNLISNAIKFSPTGAEIQVILTENKSNVQIEVKDEGIGIPEKMRKHLFKLMGENRRTGTAGERSYGLGLAIPMQIMEAHNGRLWYESEVESGSSFFIELPNN